MSNVYCTEGNVVDRVSSKNGKGWCEGVSPTLNAQDRHAVVYALEGNGARPSHMGKGFSCDGTMYTLNTIEQHCVCFRKSSKPMGKDGLGERWVEDSVTNTLNCFEFGNDCRTPQIIAYAIENYPNDSRVTVDPNGIVQTLSSRMGTGGNNTPFVLIEKPKPMKPVCVVASTSAHAEMTDGSVSPTLLCRAGTGGNQLPIVLMKETE